MALFDKPTLDPRLHAKLGQTKTIPVLRADIADKVRSLPADARVRLLKALHLIQGVPDPQERLAQIAELLDSMSPKQVTA